MVSPSDTAQRWDDKFFREAIEQYPHDMPYAQWAMNKAEAEKLAEHRAEMEAEAIGHHLEELAKRLGIEVEKNADKKDGQSNT